MAALIRRSLITLIYKGAPIKVTSNYESSEVSLVTGRTLTLADIPQTNAIGNAQSLESIEWIDNSVGECLSTDMSFTIPDTMENHILNAKVVIKDTVTGKLTTYYPINEYIRSNVDILAMYFGNSDGRKGINESNLAETNPFVLRADIARNNVDFKTGEVQIALEQYSEYDTLKAIHSSTDTIYL